MLTDRAPRTHRSSSSWDSASASPARRMIASTVPVASSAPKSSRRSSTVSRRETRLRTASVATAACRRGPNALRGAPRAESRPTSRAQKPESGRRPGGQPGHEGKNRQLLPFEQVDEVIDHWPMRCPACARPFTENERLDAVTPERHQVSELPSIAVTVTEHRLHLSLIHI